MSISFYSSDQEYTGATSLLYDREGKRKYLTQKERNAFLAEAKRKSSPEQWTFCLVLAYTGARISEVLDLRPVQVDVATNTIIMRSLKKRLSGVFRSVPVPEWLMAELEAVHGLSEKRNALIQAPIWSWCRTSAWHHIKAIMAEAGIMGLQASPKGFRHGFAVAAIQSGVPLNLVKKWLGHARLSTTAIYADAIGEEERTMAERMWGKFS